MDQWNQKKHQGGQLHQCAECITSASDDIWPALQATLPGGHEPRHPHQQPQHQVRQKALAIQIEDEGYGRDFPKLGVLENKLKKVRLTNFKFLLYNHNILQGPQVQPDALDYLPLQSVPLLVLITLR